MYLSDTKTTYFLRSSLKSRMPRLVGEKHSSLSATNNSNRPPDQLLDWNESVTFLCIPPRFQELDSKAATTHYMYCYSILLVFVYTWDPLQQNRGRLSGDFYSDPEATFAPSLYLPLTLSNLAVSWTEHWNEKHRRGTQSSSSCSSDGCDKSPE